MADRLILIRHAATGPEYVGRYVGATDVSLSSGGLEQASALAGMLNRWDPDRIFCSPLRRARETAEQADVSQDLETDDRLREIDFGDWEGRTFAEIAEAAPERVDAWAECTPTFRFPNGETIGGFHARVREVTRDVTAISEKTVTVFAHGGVIRTMICILLGLPLSNYLLFGVQPASVSVIDLYDGKGVLTGLNLKPYPETEKKDGHG